MRVNLDTQITSDLDTILTQTKRVLLALEDKSNPLDGIANPPNPIEVSRRLETLNKENARLGALITMLQKGVPVDVTKWKNASFSLYYFDDVPRLMQVLCKDSALEGGDPGGAAENK